MDRLTFLNNGKPAFRFKNCVYKNDVADRLSAYEDTGLTPEEIIKLISDYVTLQGLAEMLEDTGKELRAFKEYFDKLYGRGLEVANWH